MLAQFFQYIDDAVSATVGVSSVALRLHWRKAGEVVWITEAADSVSRFRFLRLRAIQDREEFALQLGWSDEARFPDQNCEAIMAGEARSKGTLLPRHCYVPLLSQLVLDDVVEDFPGPLLEADPPTLIRLNECVAQAVSERSSLHKLRELCEVSGVSNIGRRRLAEDSQSVVMAIFGEIRLPTDWQLIKYLTGLRDSDCEAAVAGPVSVACSLLLEHGLPFLSDPKS